MFRLTVAFGATNTIWALLFRTKERAKHCFTELSPDPMQTMVPATAIVIADDFGQTLRIHPRNVNAVMVEDLEQSKQALAENMLHQEKAVASARTRLAASDKTLSGIMTMPAFNPVPRN